MQGSLPADPDERRTWGTHSFVEDAFELPPRQKRSLPTQVHPCFINASRQAAEEMDSMQFQSEWRMPSRGVPSRAPNHRIELSGRNIEDALWRQFSACCPSSESTFQQWMPCGFAIRLNSVQPLSLRLHAPTRRSETQH